MNKIALVTDSTSDLNHEEIKKYNIHVLPLKIVYKDREYTDRVDITPEEVYNNMEVEVPTTSLPTMGEIDSLFVKLKKEGYTHVIAVTISSGLSGTHNSIRLVSENHPEMKFEIFDSKALTLAAGAIILECGEMINAGKNFDEIVEELPNIRDRIKVYYVLDTLKYLIKGGRIGKVSGNIGELLNLKPIISINKEGIYYTYTKVRGRKQSISKILDIVKESLEEKRAKVWVLHGGAKEEALELYEKVLKLANIIEVGFSDISPVAGVHTGPGLIGVTIMSE
ncbi:EDD domain protein, DegV family [Natronincola peptidivorans]|uniref:EDD domain protein, DegV family n=1 Tax=Natronincola peptidivorans TaxID=426128 RepID=A0A1I0CIA0_9FIRM|nr:DegV family protein [Natronincola peptidivorans]SET18867.1 EDD domain protein, DegV family [Natronincola peptidivorans]